MSETFYIVREKGKDGGSQYATEELAIAMAEAWTKNTGIETTIFECKAVCSLRAAYAELSDVTVLRAVGHVTIEYIDE